MKTQTMKQCEVNSSRHTSGNRLNKVNPNKSEGKLDMKNLGSQKGSLNKSPINQICGTSERNLSH